MSKTENIKIPGTVERKEFVIKLDKEISECHKKGLCYSIQNEKNAPMNVKKDENLLEYTIEKSKNASDNHTNNWNKNIDNVTGYLKLPGLIKTGELKGLYVNIIDIDNEKAYKLFLGNESLEQITEKYKWVEQHKEPYYRTHITLVTTKPLPYLNERIVVNPKTGEILGIGVFSQHNQWVTGLHSINVKSGNIWELVDGGTKSYEVLTDEQYNEIYERIEGICKHHGITYGEGTTETLGSGFKQQQNEEQSGFNQQEEAQQQDEEFDLPTTNFIKYVVSCFLPYYVEPNRDKIVFNLSGMFAKEKISIKITKKIVETFIERTNDTDSSRIPTIVNSYKKADEGKKVEGFSGLKLYLGEELAEKFIDTVEEFTKNCHEKNRNEDIYEVASQYLISKFPMLTIRDTLEDDKDNILIYNNGYYSKQKSIEEIIFSVYSYDFKPYEAKYITYYLKFANIVDREDCDKNLHLINVKDGMYNYKSKELLPHDPKYLSLIQLPIKYDVTKKCPRFLKFIKESVAEPDQENLLNSIAYIPYRHNKKEIVNFLLGEGYNGKSLLLKGLSDYIFGK